MSDVLQGRDLQRLVLSRSYSSIRRSSCHTLMLFTPVRRLPIGRLIVTDSRRVAHAAMVFHMTVRPRSNRPTGMRRWVKTGGSTGPRNHTAAVRRRAVSSGGSRASAVDKAVGAGRRAAALRRGQLDWPRLTTRLIATATTKVPKK